MIKLHSWKNLFALLFVPLIVMLIFASPALANDASLYFSPGSGTRYVGQIFTVSVRVNSGSHTTNSYKAVLTFPTDKLAVTSMSLSGSICTLQIPPSPAFSNTQGTATFECGHQGAFAGTAGTIGSVSFSVKTTGSARLAFSPSSQIKAADGQGTEVLGSTGSGTFDLQPAPVSAPEVSSTTHADQNSCYRQNSVKLSWTKPTGSDGFSYTLDNNAETTPDNVSEGTGTEKTYDNLSDGIYYFHVKAHGTSGWGGTTHFRLQIDTTPPESFEVTSDPPAENVTSAPLIGAAANDKTCGIDHYELSLDGSAFKTAKMPHKFERIREGTHTVTVRAIDKAGNQRDSSLTLNVIDVADPVITQPKDGSYLPILEELVIQGKAPEGLVELYLNDDFLARVESDGTFEYTHRDFLKPGSYKLVAIYVTEGGIESSPDEVNFTIDPFAVSLFGITLPGWLVYSLLLGTIILLFILLLRYLRKVRSFDHHVIEDLNEIEKRVEKDIEQTERELERAAEETLQDGDEGHLREMEHTLERKIEEAEGAVKKDLEEQLEKIKRHHQKRKRKVKIP